VTELAVVDEVDAPLLLQADDIADRALELFLEGGLVSILAKGALLTEFEKLRRARQASYVGRENPISHSFSSRLHH
jgi:hypothetical protein